MMFIRHGQEWVNETGVASADDVEIFDVVRVYTAQWHDEKESFEKGIVMAVVEQDDSDELIVELEDGRRITCRAGDFDLGMDRVCWPVE